jgi:hypothetical protein
LTTDIPTQLGCYWYHGDMGYNALIVWVSSDGMVLRVGSVEAQPPAAQPLAGAAGSSYCRRLTVTESSQSHTRMLKGFQRVLD